MVLILESCSLEKSSAALGGTPKLLFELRDRLRDWLKLQPHLPQNVPDYILEHIIFGVKMSLEQAKHKLDMLYTVRRHVPELFAARDPRNSNFTELHKMIQTVYLPKLTPENHTVCIVRPIADNYRKFRAADGVKYLYMMGDIVTCETRNLGHIVIVDLSKATLGWLTAHSPTLLKKSEVVATEAYAIRVKGIHVINSTGMANQLLALAQSVLKPKLSKRIHVHHSPGSYESLHKLIPKSILPKDYDGDEISIGELSKKWQQKVDDYRDWFLEQEKILVDERLRPGAALDTDNLFGTVGSFRKLDVD